MRKSELMQLLEGVPDDADIRIDQPTHDYWRRHLATDISAVDEVKVKASAYHDDRDVIQSDDDWDSDDQTVFVLR